MLFYFTFTGKDGITDAEIEIYTHFKRVKTILSEANKFTRYCQMFANPLPEMLSLMLPELQAAANAIDKYMSIEMGSKNSQQLVEELVKELKIEDFMNEKYIYRTFISPSQILIVEPDESGTPYFWLPDLRNVQGFKISDKGEFVYVAIKSAEQLVTYCDQYYRVFDIRDSRLQTPLMEVEHNLGYCPATYLWNNPLTTDDNFQRRTPAVAAENSIDAYIFHQGSRSYYELYAKFDIVSTLSQKCNQLVNGKSCNGAYFETFDEFGNPINIPCSCRNSKFLGPGSELKVTLPSSITGEPIASALPEVVRFTGADVGRLHFNAQRSLEYEDNLYNILIGGNPEAVNNKAINEKQVSAIFEQKRKIIKMYAGQMERVHKFIMETAAKLAFNDFVSAVVDYGTVFNIETKEYLSAAYKDAKESGAGIAKLIALKEQIINSEANTQVEAARLKSINLLSEFPDLQPSELIELRRLNAIDNFTLLYHLQLPYLIQRYEREIGKITGKENTEAIKKILLNYLNFTQNEQQEI